MKYEAILALHNQTNPDTGLTIKGKVEELTGLEKVESNGANPKFTWEQVIAKEAELQADYDSKQYQRDRLTEYPSIEALVVALYDTDDKAEIDKKRAEIKKKYPKP
jgi:hypothetical protein